MADNKEWKKEMMNWRKSELIDLLEKTIAKNLTEPAVGKRMLGIDTCALYIRSTTIDQAIELMKRDISGQPLTAVVDGELFVTLINTNSQ